MGIPRFVILAVFFICCCHGNHGAGDASASTSEMEETMDMIISMQDKSVGKPDPSVGDIVAAMGPHDKRNADEMGTYFEGDMLQSAPHQHGVVPRWTNGIVPYHIEGDFDAAQLSLISQAINAIQSYTCIRFQPTSTGRHRDYIAITSERSGCWSNVGRVGGRQELNLQIPGCIYGSGIAIHEMLHALGFPHEHNRRDRDKYVKIAVQNVEPREAHNFDKVAYTGFGVEYDYGSIMHYSKTAFTRNGLQTIYPRVANAQIGQRKGLSKLDIRELNKLYGCNDKYLTGQVTNRQGQYGTGSATQTSTDRPSFWTSWFKKFTFPRA